MHAQQLELALNDDRHRMEHLCTEMAMIWSRRQLQKLHLGNRFRLMFGQPLLPQG